MAADPIYVETEEEIPEVVERIRRTNSQDTMLVLPARSRVGQSRFNFQLLKNYASKMGKKVTVVCDDPAVQKMASETGFVVFGTVGPAGEGIPAKDPPPPAPRKWWQRKGPLVSPHIGVVAPTKLITKTATELKPGRFLLYMAMLMILLVGLSAMAVFVPSASVTLIAQVAHTNDLSQPKVCPAQGCSPGLIFPRGQRLKDNKDSLEFAQISPDTLVKWKSTATVTVQAVIPGTVGNVGDNVINAIEDLVYDPSKVTATNPQAAAGGSDPSTTPLMTESDFDAGRAQLEQSLHQEIAQQLEAGLQKGEKLSS